MPELTTTLEAGYPNSDYTFWIGVFMPSQTPANIVAKFHQELQKALQAAAVKDNSPRSGSSRCPSRRRSSMPR